MPELTSMQKAYIEFVRERLDLSRNYACQSEAEALRHWGALEYHCEQLLELIAELTGDAR